MSTAEFLTLFSIGFLIGFLLVQGVFWLQRRRGERRWQRHMKELRDAALIREARYGSGKTRGL